MIKNIFRASFLFSVSELIQKGGVYLLTPLLTQVLMPLEYGLLSSVFILISSSAVVFSLSFHGVITRYSGVYKGTVKLAFRSTLLSLLLILNFLFFLILYFFREQINYHYFDDNLVQSELLSIIFILVTQSVFVFGITYFKVNVKLRSFACFFNLYYIFQFIGVVVFVINLKLAVSAYIYILFLSNLIYLFSFLIYYYKENGFLFEVRFIKRIFKYSFFVFPVDVLSIASAFLDRYFVVVFIGMTGVGLYYVAYQLSVITQLIALSINSALIPYFYRASKIDIVKFCNVIYEVYIPIIGLLTYLFILISVFLVDYIFPLEYVSIKKLLPILFFSTFLIPVYLILTNILTLRVEMQKAKLYGALFLLVLNALITSLLINEYGILGAALSTLIMNFLSVILFFSIIKSHGVTCLKVGTFFKVFLVLLTLVIIMILEVPVLYFYLYVFSSLFYYCFFILKNISGKVKFMGSYLASFK